MSTLEFDSSNPLVLKRRKADTESDSEPDELLVDDISNNRNKSKRRQRGGVNADEYLSDSSDDEEIPNNNMQKTKESKDDSDDMFGSDDEDNDNDDDETSQGVPKNKKKKNAVELLDIDEFEKELNQDEDGFNDARFDSHMNEDDDDDDDEDDDDEAPNDYYLDPESQHYRKPKRDPKMDAFSLKDDEGAYDKDGNYYRVVESDQEEDEDWQGVKKSEIKKAKIAEDKRKQIEEDKLRAKAQDLSENSEELCNKLISMLEPLQSPMELLQNLAKAKPKKVIKGKKIKLSEEERQKEQEIGDKVTLITSCCETIGEEWFEDIYSLEREEIIRRFKDHFGHNYVRPKSEATVEEAQDSLKEWQFRWLGDSQIHGPYTTHEMKYWKETYFQDRVEVRKIGQTDFTHVSQMTF